MTTMCSVDRMSGTPGNGAGSPPPSLSATAPLAPYVSRDRPAPTVITGTGHYPAQRMATYGRRMAARAAADPRLPVWLRRAAACAAGAIVALWLAWWAGLALAALIMVVDGLFTSRTSAVIPATVRVGSAQRKTRRRLARLSQAGYLCLHSRRIPTVPAWGGEAAGAAGHTCVVAHIVVGPAGVYAVDSQRWDRRLSVRATQGRLYHGPFGQADRLGQARWRAAETARLISDTLGRPVTVRPAMVVYGPPVPWVVARIGGVDVFSGRRLRKYLRRETCANRTRRLDERQIELIHAVAAQVLPPAR